MALSGSKRTGIIATLASGAAALALSLSPALAQTAGDQDQDATSGPGLRGAVAPQMRPLAERDSALAAARRGQTAPPLPATYSAGTGEAAPDAAINYGKARKPVRLPKPYPPLRTGKPALPQLEPYKSSYIARRQARQRLPDDPQAQEPPPTGVAAVPTIPVRRAKPPEANPYEPVGIDVGSLRLKPYVEGAFGYDTNPGRVENPSKGSTLGRVDVGTTFESLWSVHSLKGELRAGYSDYLQVKNVNRPDAAGKVDGRIDVTRDTELDYGGTVNVTTIRSGSPEIQPGSSNISSTNQPINWNVAGYVGAAQRFNRLELSMRGTIERAETGDATFSDGSKQLLHLNDYTTVGVRPRVSYEVSPLFKPFVEATIDQRTYDSAADVNGYQRNSRGYALRAGASFEFDGKLKGEASGGYVEREYKDPRLVRLRGPTFDAALIYTATPLTTVTLRGSTTTNETTVPNASGAISRRAQIEISHDLLRNVKITAQASYQATSYQGENISSSFTGSSTGLNERTINAGVKAEYSLTRTVVVKASYAYERLKTTVPGSDYTANVFLLGLRLQR
ncbi:MAG TPA: outer membrane beta-barrel protein [Rhodoblastus sp.]|nr:outer membrane beta-barrel protein [Rhodoblastus sp.]